MEMLSNLQDSTTNEHQDFPPRFLLKLPCSPSPASFWERAHDRGDCLGAKASWREGRLNGTVSNGQFSSQEGAIGVKM